MKIKGFPYVDVLPFLAEHIQPSDQMLVMGCGTELPLQLSRDGYGTRQGGDTQKVSPRRRMMFQLAGEKEEAVWWYMFAYSRS